MSELTILEYVEPIPVVLAFQRGGSNAPADGAVLRPEQQGTIGNPSDLSPGRT
jgi:hypothetical protein